MGVRYCNLKELNNRLTEQIEGDEWLKKTWDAIDFIDSVVKGETELMPDGEEKPIKVNRATRRLINRVTKKKDKEIVH